MNRNFWHIPTPIPRKHTYQVKKEYSIYDNANIYEFLKRSSAKKKAIPEEEIKKLGIQKFQEGYKSGYKVGDQRGFDKGAIEAAKRAFTKVSFDPDQYPGFKDIYVESDAELSRVFDQIPLIRGELFRGKKGQLVQNTESSLRRSMKVSRELVGQMKGESIEYPLVNEHVQKDLGITITERLSQAYLKELSKNIGYELDKDKAETIRSGQKRYKKLSNKVIDHISEREFQTLEDIFNLPPEEISPISPISPLAFTPTTPKSSKKKRRRRPIPQGPLLSPLSPTISTFGTPQTLSPTSPHSPEGFIYPSPEVYRIMSPQKVRTLNTLAMYGRSPQEQAFIYQMSMSQGQKYSPPIKPLAPEIALASSLGRTRSQTAKKKKK